MGKDPSRRGMIVTCGMGGAEAKGTNLVVWDLDKLHWYEDLIKLVNRIMPLSDSKDHVKECEAQRDEWKRRLADAKSTSEWQIAFGNAFPHLMGDAKPEGEAAEAEQIQKFKLPEGHPLCVINIFDVVFVPGSGGEEVLCACREGDISSIWCINIKDPKATGPIWSVDDYKICRLSWCPPTQPRDCVLATLCTRSDGTHEVLTSPHRHETLFGISCDPLTLFGMLYVDCHCVESVFILCHWAGCWLLVQTHRDDAFAALVTSADIRMPIS